MKKYFSGLLIILISLFLVQCAKRGTPTGGKLDSIPPVFLRAAPENYSVNFNKKEIRIYFDEYIKLEKPQQQIIISPPMELKPDITPLGSAQKYIRIRINDTLQENTTYAFNFGNSVVDNNEGNQLPYFKYVFSTGSYIDSLSVSGTISDALLKEANPYISVMLYEVDENYSDSLVYKTPPRYITNTLDSLKTFELSNLKEGPYQLIAIQDLNNDYKYNPGREKIGFIDQRITIPTDTTFNLVMFREELSFKAERPKQETNQKILIGYRGKTDLDSIKFKFLNPEAADIEYRISKVTDKDSLYFYYKPPLETDSLRLQITTPNLSDTLLTRLTDIPKDSLIIALQPSGNLDFGKKVLLNANFPLVKKNDTLIKIINKDSLAVTFTSEIRPYENSLLLKFDHNENETYGITVLPGAITDFLNNTNDTIRANLRTRAYSDYGNLNLNLQNVRNFPIIIQLTDEKGVVIAEKYSTSESKFRFELVSPGKYLIRVIYDTNENGKWDTGNYLKKIMPEEIIYFPDLMDIRPNWDINETFILK
jgi:uncharacterized protein (DUF2141 family)